MLKKGDISGEQWWIIGFFVLGIMAIVFFLWVVLAAKSAEEGVFDMVLKLFR